MRPTCRRWCVPSRGCAERPPIADVFQLLSPDVLVDARMRRRVTPESQPGLALLVIGLGPKYEAGVNAHIGSSPRCALMIDQATSLRVERSNSPMVIAAT